MSQYPTFSNQSGYDPNLDVILYRTQDGLSSGKNGQNVFFLQLRSYNNTLPKIELFRSTPTQSNPDMKRSFRLSREEWEFLKGHIAEIDGVWNQMLAQAQQQS